MATPRVSLPLVGKPIEDLLLWRDPKKSGIVSGGITLVYLLLEWSGLSLLTIVSWATLLAAGGSWLWANVGGMVGRTGPPVPKVLKEGLTEEQVRDVVEKARPVLNKGLAFVARVAEGKDLKLTGVLCGVCWLLANIGYYFSVLGLFFLVAVVAFVGPKVYELKKDDCDKYAAIAADKANELYVKLQSSLPKAASKTHQQ